jgi:hypothetical protein
MKRKLALSKETLRILDDRELTFVVGGGGKDDHDHDHHNGHHNGSRGSGNGCDSSNCKESHSN